MSTEETNRVKLIHTEFKQSIWLDFIDREIMRSGKLQKLIENDGIRGVTSNPAIFEQAISASSDYDADINGQKKNEFRTHVLAIIFFKHRAL